MDRRPAAMMATTVVCVWVHGEYPYGVEYVTRLRAMVARWIDRPFRFVCLTDRPWLLPDDVQAVAVQKKTGFAPWTKLEVFNPERDFRGRVLYLDLDSLIVAPLAPILDAPGSFLITADPAQPGQRSKDAYGRAIVRRFNSSVMVWDADQAPTALYTAWTRDVPARLSGDQDWIGERLPQAATLPRAWFPRISEAIRPPWDADAKIVLVKVPKNHVLERAEPWFGPLWGAA
jgi:hypothetical protein